MKTKAAYFNYIGSIELPLQCIDDCSHSGQCIDDVTRWLEQPEIKEELREINPKQLIKELEQYGAWTEEELNNHQYNLERILWIAANDIKEQD